MKGEKLCFACLMVCVQLVFCGAAEAQLSEAAKSAVLISNHYDVVPNITYGVADNYELKLDVYRPTTAKAPTPVVKLIHGGGWARHDKEGEVMSLLPYLEMGWAAVNVEYRLARVSLAPQVRRPSYSPWTQPAGPRLPGNPRRLIGHRRTV